MIFIYELGLMQTVLNKRKPVVLLNFAFPVFIDELLRLIL